MKKVRQGDSIPRVLRQPNNGIKGYENKSGEEQMRLFSKLVQEERRKAVRKLWPKLDPVARSFVMEKLGCFAGPESPQEFFRPRFESRRAVGPEVRRQIKIVKKSIEAMEELSRRLEQLPFKIACYEQLIPALRSALAILENLKIVTARHFSGPADLDIRSIIEAQEFVKRRSTHRKSPVTLSTAAVADILYLNERELNNLHYYREEAVQKALARFKKKPGYQEYVEAMGELLRDWTVSLPEEEAGQKALEN